MLYPFQNIKHKDIEGETAMKIGYIRVSTQEQNTVRQEAMQWLDMRPSTFYRKIRG